MRIKVTSTIDDLASDLRKIPVMAAKDMARITKMNAQRGNKNAKAYAKESAGAHGKHYHKAFTVEMLSPLSYEYGPDSSRPQGDMSFEFGSRNQPPHLDLSRSADLLGPMFARDVAKLPDRWFWPA